MIPGWLQEKGTAYLAQPLSFIPERQKNWEAFLQQGWPTHWPYMDDVWLKQKVFDWPTPPVLSVLPPVIADDQSTDTILFVFVNGYFVPQWSKCELLPTEVMAGQWREALSQQETVARHFRSTDWKGQPFACLNTALCADGLFLSVPDHCVISTPIHLLFVATASDPFMAHPRHHVMVGRGAQLTLVEEYRSISEQTYWMNSVMTIHLGEQARMDYYKIQRESMGAVHLAHTMIQQRQQSRINHVVYSAGAQIAQDEVMVQLQGQGAACTTSGFYHLQADRQYQGHHIRLEHTASQTRSDLLYKGIADQKSRAVFDGQLYVAQDVREVVAYQANHNWLLSSKAEVYSKPALEIYADAVQCKHGATIGQMDQAALFYLRSRGIEQAEAQAMLRQGFAEDICRRIAHPEVKARVQACMEAA
jgi:Fe-S cluster assembly protein SufD